MKVNIREEFLNSTCAASEDSGESICVGDRPGRYRTALSENLSSEEVVATFFLCSSSSCLLSLYFDFNLYILSFFSDFLVLLLIVAVTALYLNPGRVLFG